jgi:hypothetical protein
MTAMRNPDAKHTDFADLVGVIPSNPKLLPSNLDMVLERNGIFLVGEWKRPSESISLGQDILLKNLSKMSNFLVLVIEGNTDNGMVVNKISIYDKKFENGWSSVELKEIGNNIDDLKNIIRMWYAKANGGTI